MNSTGSLFSQVLSLFQRSDFARQCGRSKRNIAPKVLADVDRMAFDAAPIWDRLACRRPLGWSA
jgi:hypothetical protein